MATITNLPMQNPLGGDEAAFAAQLPKLAEDAAFCQAIGCRRFQLVLGATTVNGQSKDERWALVTKRLSAIGAVLARHEVSLRLEFLGPLMFRRARTRPAPRAGSGRAAPPHPFRSSGRSPRRCAVRSLGAEHRVTLDAWHWYHSGGTVADIRAAPAARSSTSMFRREAHAAEDVLDNMRHLRAKASST